VLSHLKPFVLRFLASLSSSSGGWDMLIGGCQQPHQNEKGEPKLHDDQEKWKGLCNSRWGFNSLPTDYPASWKIFYLQNNLQDLVSSLNDYPDFKHFYRTLDISAEALTMLELTLFTPKQLKSGTPPQSLPSPPS